MRILSATLMAIFPISANAAFKYGDGKIISGLPADESAVNCGKWSYDTKKQKCVFSYEFDKRVGYGGWTLRVFFDKNRKVESMTVSWWSSGVSSSWEPAPEGKHKRKNWAKEDAEAIVKFFNELPLLTPERAKELISKARASEARKKSLSGID